ncbi:Hypothetical protein ETEE_4080 [Edwardsiella anguillarum ET080813]|uniref:Uncharacterized protein n=1 Tax=Edwardsiella anguillarum ET080813 TaxID=667120 RepID=A0A076LR55_9GAMM|nr:Hypothetical protein ETEE_4080 [Edwardsiella anguillarum ET080813]
MGKIDHGGEYGINYALAANYFHLASKFAINISITDDIGLNRKRSAATV